MTRSFNVKVIHELIKVCSAYNLIARDAIVVINNILKETLSSRIKYPQNLTIENYYRYKDIIYKELDEHIKDSIYKAPHILLLLSFDTQLTPFINQLVLEQIHKLKLNILYQGLETQEEQSNELLNKIKLIKINEQQE